MGSLFSKNENDENVQSARGARTQVRLLVLHNKPQDPRAKINKFCDALNSYRPPITLINNRNHVKHQKISDNTPIEGWIKAQSDNKHIVLICLLANYNLPSLPGGTIVFSFSNPFVNHANSICIDVDFETATTESILQNMDELADAIKGEMNQ